MIPSLDGWQTKAKETPSPHEIRLTLLDTNPVFQCLGEVFQCLQKSKHITLNKIKGLELSQT